MNKLFKFAAAVSAMLATLSISACAAEFEKTSTYTDGQFTDVPASEWYAAEVKSTYELGLMNGKSSTIFAPDGKVTVAEGITIASRVHANYNGKTIEAVQGDNWYDMYVAYALENGLIEDGHFENYDRSIMRYEVAEMFANSMPADYFNEINEIKDIPDVAETEEYYDDLLMLYKAGILLGSDEYGNFYATNPITRSETAAIINRVALPQNRKTGTLKQYGNRDQAVFLIDDESYGLAPHGARVFGSGWLLEDIHTTAFNTNGSTSATLIDSFDDSSVLAHRDVKVQTRGVVKTEIKLYSSGNGARILFVDSDGKAFLEASQKDGKIFINGDKQYDTGFEFIKGDIWLYFELSLDNDTVYVAANGREIGTYPTIASKDLARLTVATSDNEKLTLTLKETHMYVNYDVYDSFSMTGTGEAPFGWTVNGNVTASPIFTGSSDTGVLITNAGTASKKFDAVSGKFVYETFVLVPKGQSAYVALLNGGAEALKVEAASDGRFVASGYEVRKFNNEVWQQIRVEADTYSDTALIKINGKKCITVPFTSDSVDEIVVGFDGNGEMRFDNVELFNVFDYADYTPVPVPVNDDEWYVGMSVCSLWREGTHYGWRCVDGYPEAEPVLGFYDEGLPEVADWEIKFLVEHGYDFQHYCWYLGSQGNAPIKDTRLSSAIVDGYFHAKYSDMMKMSIMWENASCSYRDSANFRKYVWPYWCEWYFSDSRYMTIDNKPVLTIYQVPKFITNMGGEQGAKDAIAFMDEEIKKLGFDGMIIIGCVRVDNTDAATLQKYKDMGFDGYICYTLGENSYSADFQKERMTAASEKDFVTFFPGIGVGFNDIGWTEIRTPNATPEAHKEVMKWVKSDYMSLIAERTEDSWMSHFVMNNTWNEYGEGHYIMPAGLNGFGYVDANRAVFSKVSGHDDSAHFDVVLTDNQKSRLGYLYAGTHTSMRKLELEADADSNTNNELIKEWNFEDESNMSQWEFLMNVKNIKYDSEEKAFYGETTTNDGAIKNLGGDTSKIDASKARFCRIVMKLGGGITSNGELYFMQDGDTNWSSSKGYSFGIPGKDGYQEIVIDLYKNDYWNGTISQLRFDPCGTPSEFYLKSIQFYSEKAKNTFNINVDGTDMYIKPSCVLKTDKEVYIAGNPSEGFYSLQNLYHVWNRKTGKLYIKTFTGTEFDFTVGSDTALVNGKETKLDRAVDTYDGLVRVPLYFIYDNSGIEYEKTDDGVSVVVRGEEVKDAITSRVDNQWEFNVAGDNENWNIACASGGVSDGNIFFTSTSVSSTASGYDPQIQNKSIYMEAKSHTMLDIRLRAEYIGEPFDKTLSVYFATGTDTALSEKKTVRAKLDELEPDEEGYYNITLDMSSNELWTGKINTIRVDPTNSNGYFEIDYIRFRMDPDLEEQLAAEKEKEELEKKLLMAADEGAPFYMANPDAEGGSDNLGGYSPNGECTIVKDDEIEGNHAYLVKATVKDKKSWTYFIVKTRFKPGVTYKVEYDIKAVSDQNGEDITNAAFSPNFRYTDKLADGTVKSGADHPISEGTVKTSTGDGWVHVSCTHTVSVNSTDRSTDQFTIYADPGGDDITPSNRTYMLDNFKISVVE